MNNCLNILSLTEKTRLVVTIEIKKKTEIYQSGTFISPILTFSFDRKSLFINQVTIQNREKYLPINITKHKMPIQAGNNTFLSVSFVIGRGFCIFRQRVVGTKLSEMDIELLFPALNFFY